MKYLVSHDYLDTTPISLDKILEMAFDPKTENHYAGYLNYVLSNAKRILKTIGKNLNDVEFNIHQNGCIHPFGEGGHSYSERFYTWVDEKDLPPFPDNIQKAR